MNEGSGDNVKPEKDAPADALNITVQAQQGGEVQFRIKRTAKLGKLFNAFAQKKAVDVRHLRFLFDGQRVTAEQTAEEIGLEDGDVLDAMIEQQGGGR